MAVHVALLHQQNNRVRRPRVFRDRTHPLDAYNDVEIIERYRLPRPLIIELHDLIQNDIEPQTRRNKAVPAMLQLFCALRFYACGSFQRVVGDGLGLHRSTVSRIVNRVSSAIVRHHRRYITFPTTQAAKQDMKANFFDVAQLPGVIGAIDGTHIRICTPHVDEHLYVGRKGGHSLNVLAVCSHDLKFTYVVAKYPGSTNDAFIWSTCALNRTFQHEDMEDEWLLGDSG